MTNDLEYQLIFTDGLSAFSFLSYDSFEQAEQAALSTNRPCRIRECGTDTFSGVFIDRIRFEMVGA